MGQVVETLIRKVYINLNLLNYLEINLNIIYKMSYQLSDKLQKEVDKIVYLSL